MGSVRFTYFLAIAALMLAAKPFLGFSMFSRVTNSTESHIIVKAFTKRKLEYLEDGNFDMAAIQKRLANPFLPLVILFSGLINALYPAVSKNPGEATNSLLARILYGLLPPPHLYLLSGKLTI